MHQSSKEFEVRPDRTDDGGVRCPKTYNGENGVVTFSNLL